MFQLPFPFKKAGAGKERRRAYRYAPPDVCLVEFETPEAVSRRMGEIKDISADGIRFATIFRLKKKQPITLHIFFPKTFPGPKSTTLGVTVARVYKAEGSNRYRVGCLFSEISEQNREVFSQFAVWCESQTTEV